MDPMTWMWERAREMLEQAERRDCAGTRSALPTRGSHEPAIDIVQCGGELCVLIALPGVDPASIEVHLDDDWLVVRGERSVPVRFRGARFQRIELTYGPFERRVPLPPGRYRATDRDVTFGCLMQTLMRMEP